MKTVVILFADSNSFHLFDKSFGGKSAFDRSLEWAAAVQNSAGTVVLASAQNAEKCSMEAALSGSAVEIMSKDAWTVTSLLDQLVSSAEKYGADAIIYAWADCPFLDGAVTKEITDTHAEYAAEYTFADGYPYGLTPEAIDKSSAKILRQLSVSTQKEAGEKRVSRDSIFSVIKTEINSFEIETVIAPKDWRLYRISLDCGSKAGLLACTALYNCGIGGKNAEQLSDAAAAAAGVLKTVPAFYNVQISEKCTDFCLYSPYSADAEKSGSHMMNLSDFNKVAEKISDFSENAVVGFSLWGEPLENPDFAEFVKSVLFYPGLSVLIETNGQKVSDELCRKIKLIADGAPERTNGYEKIIWIVSIDAFTKETYAKIHGNEDGFAVANAAAALLVQYFDGSVYPQMVRMNQNESELENFYRFWSDKNSPTHGKIIIQKYDSFCGLLPECKPADLAPLERNPCWHIRRDMTVLADGSVPFCREMMRGSIIGNAFTESLEAIWARLTPAVKDHMEKKYSEKCRKCDEYYTFNF